VTVVNFRITCALLTLLIVAVGLTACGESTRSSQLPLPVSAPSIPVEDAFSTYETIQQLQPLVKAVVAYTDADYLALDDFALSTTVQQVAETKLNTVIGAQTDWLDFLDQRAFAIIAPAPTNEAALDFNTSLDSWLDLQTEGVGRWEQCLRDYSTEIGITACVLLGVDSSSEGKSLVDYTGSLKALMSQLGIEIS